MKHEYGFELDLSKLSSNDISRAIITMLGCHKNNNDLEGNIESDEDYVWWHPFGNYILYNDGSLCCYFCKSYVNVKGTYRNIIEDEDFKEAIEQLQ